MTCSPKAQTLIINELFEWLFAVKYKLIREYSLVLWECGTRRKSSSFVDDINQAYECDWQERSPNHISIFCSLGVWASCFSLQLKDTRFDNLDLDDSNDAEALYLLFNQMLLVISEVFSDLTQMYRQATGLNNGREKLSEGSPYSIGDIIAFINRVVKHKAEGKTGHRFHSCNHHLPIRFADSKKTRKSAKSIAIGNISNLADKKSIYLPSLPKLIISLANAYYHLDIILRKDENYQRITSQYG